MSTDIALDAKVIARSKGHGNRMPSRVGYDECLHVRRHIRTRIRVSNTRPCCIPTFWGKALCTYWDISLMCDPCDCSEHHWGGRNLSSQAQHYGSATTLHWKRHKSLVDHDGKWDGIDIAKLMHTCTHARTQLTSELSEVLRLPDGGSETLQTCGRRLLHHCTVSSTVYN